MRVISKHPHELVCVSPVERRATLTPIIKLLHDRHDLTSWALTVTNCAKHSHRILVITHFSVRGSGVGRALSILERHQGNGGAGAVRAPFG
jgi:hypothetical protein